MKKLILLGAIAACLMIPTTSKANKVVGGTAVVDRYEKTSAGWRVYFHCNFSMNWCCELDGIGRVIAVNLPNLTIDPAGDTSFDEDELNGYVETTEEP